MYNSKLESFRYNKYNNSNSDFACRKEGEYYMASTKKITGSLQDSKGIWTVRIRINDLETGEVRQRSKSTGLPVKGCNKRKANKAMLEILDEIEKEEASPVKTKCVRNDGPLFETYVRNWLERKAVSKKENTSISYQQYADTHILPELGDYPVKKITHQMLQDYCNKKAETLSASSIKKHWVVINGALKDAVRDGVIPVNVASKDYVDLPQIKPYVGKAYDTEQVSKLLKAAAEIGEPIHSAIMLAVCYGLRRSEVCGMRWRDIDFKKKTMLVQNTVTKQGHQIWEVEETKTSAGRRTIDLIDATIPYLEKLKKYHTEKGFTDDHVCLHPDGRRVRPDYVTYKTSWLMKKYGLPHIRVHDLRHTAASLLASKVTPKQLQCFLGHSDVSVTLNVYTHLFSEERKGTSDAMSSILNDVI